jgi:hypothetical protein
MNFLTAGLRVSGDYDDNALNSNQNQQSNLVASIQPRLGWHVSGAAIDWESDYAPALSRSQRFSAYDSFSHLLDSALQVRVTKRLWLRAHEAFLSSTNPFDQLHATESATAPGSHGVPDVALPATTGGVRTEQASIGAVYALSAHSTAGIDGEFFSAKYNLLPSVETPGQVLQDSRTAGGHGYYTRQVTPHQWTGFNYHVQKAIFNHGQSSSLVHSLAYTHTIMFSRSMTCAFFAGPERSVTENAPGTFAPLAAVLSGSRSNWYWSGGATGRWIGKQTTLTASFSRQVNSGGVLGVAKLSHASAELSQQFARKWTARLLASYDENLALATPMALSYVSVVGGLTDRLSPNLSLEFQYWRVHSSSTGSLPAVLLADHNRVSMSLTYDFRYPLSR